MPRDDQHKISAKANAGTPRLAQLLPPLHALKVLISGLRGNHSPIETAADERQIATIERRSLALPPPLAGTISYLQGGRPQGRRIIFLHGTPGNAKGWADYMLGISTGRLHIAVDRPGYGLSRPRRAVVSLKRQALAIRPLLETMGAKRPILIGHSLGASVAMQAAIDHPGSVGGILLLAGALDPSLEEIHWAQRLGAIKPIAGWLPRSIDNANRELMGLKRDLILMADRIHEVGIPVGMVHGDGDPLVPYANIAYLQRKLVRAPLEQVTLKNRDHFIPWRSKPDIDAAIESLVRRVRKQNRL